MNFKNNQLSKRKKLDLYQKMLLPRMIEEKMLSLLRQGKISKWFSGIGQEAISVGCAEALREDDLICTLHRNLGVFTSRNIPLGRLFAQLQGKFGGFTQGRDRSFHFGSKEHQIAGMISHLGPQLSVACGAALAYKLKNQNKVALAFTGEGGTSEGEFHEALNVASVWQLPVIFVIENNGYGLSTPTGEQYRCKNLTTRAPGYGMKSLSLNGNNILSVYQKIKKIANKLRKTPEPCLIECKTFRMRGHEEASGTKYVPPELLEQWSEKDPISNYEDYLLDQGVLSEKMIAGIKDNFSKTIDSEWKRAIEEESIQSNPETEESDVFEHFDFKQISFNSENSEKRRFIDSISEALDLAMGKFQNLVLMGQDIAEYGGVFKATEGMFDKYGADRVRNTPLCESAILGIALGLSLENIKSMVEMQFADFVSCGFNQIVNNLAKVHYRWGQNADVVIRMPCGAGVGAGPFHSQTNETWFTHIPGLKIVYPSSPYDAKGLLLASFEDPNPVLFYEHKALYRKISEMVPKDYYTIQLGKAKLIREGTKVSIITYGMGVHWAEDTVGELKVDAEILDLRTLNPLDYEAIENTVKKTSKVLILHEDTLFGGIGGEISAHISENYFEYLDAPITRVASLNTPVPFADSLEKQFLANSKLKEKLVNLINY